MSRSRGKRYSGGQKLNLKKVFAVIIAIFVVAMFVFVIKTLLSKNKGEKITNDYYFTSFSNNKYGVIDAKGKSIIEPSYAEYIVIPNNKKDIFLCTYDVNYEDSTYKTKALNAKNEEILGQYEQIEALDNFDNQNNIFYEQNAIKVRKNGKYGIINIEGKEILPCNYDKIETLKGVENSILIEQEGKIGLVDSNGKIVMEPTYKEIKPLGTDYKLGYIVVNNENQYGIVDCNNKVVLETKYADILPVTENNIFVVKEAEAYTLMDKEGNNLLQTTYTNITGIKNGNAIVENKSKYGVITTTGEEVVPIKYDEIAFAFTDTFIVKQNNQYGLVKKADQVVLELKYANMRYIDKADFMEVSEDNIESDLISSDLTVKLTGIVTEVNTTKGYMRVRVNNEYKYYNFKFEEKKNTEVLTENNLFLDKKNDKYGYIDKDGNVVVDYIYDDGTEQNAYGYVAVKKDRKWGSLDKEGKTIVEPQYDLEDVMKIDFIGQWYLETDVNMNCYTK